MAIQAIQHLNNKSYQIAPVIFRPANIDFVLVNNS